MTSVLKFAIAPTAVLAFSLVPSFAQQSDAERQLMLKLMQDTKIVAVMDVTDPAKFVDDKNPNTLEIVFVKDPKFGKSHVSDDGEVIFDNDSSSDEQQNLITKAFEIRAKLRMP